jgi:hypothetical protein
LWRLLYNTDYYLSILKLGSQKAVGDIFQEINSALFNGGYGVNIPDINIKNTFGLMGDRHSGNRVIKLLKDGSTGINPNAIGGYVNDENSQNSLIYGKKLLLPPVTGGKKINKTHKRHYKRHNKTNKKYNKIYKRYKTICKQKRYKKHKKTNKK